MRGRKKAIVLSRVLPYDELSLFCTEMSMLLQSGMSIFDGIAAHIQAQTGRLPRQGDKPRDIFEALYLGILDGLSLSQAMERCGVFPADFVSLVRIGEESGSLDEIMNRMADHYRRDNAVLNEIRSALTYPILTLSMMAVILQILTRKVFPVFTSIYASLGGSLPESAAASIAVGSGCAGVLTVLAAALVLLAAAVWLLRLFPAGVRILDILKNHLPVVRRVSRQLTASRITSSLAMLLDAGYDARDSLDKIRQGITDAQTKDRLAACCALLQRGDADGRPVSLAEALCGMGLWNDTECQMVRSAARFGNLDDILHQVAQDSMNRAEEQIARAVSLIEPIMIAITAVLIGSILLSVMLPLSGIMAAIG